MLPAIITIIHYSVLSQHLSASSMLNSTAQTQWITYNCTPYFSLPTPPSIPSAGNSFVPGFYSETQGCIFLPMDRGAWQAIVHGVTKSWTQLNNSLLRSLITSRTLERLQKDLSKRKPWTYLHFKEIIWATWLRVDWRRPEWMWWCFSH